MTTENGAFVSKAQMQEWADQYDASKKCYEELRTEVLFAINKSLEGSGIQTHSVTARVKDKKSFLDKIALKRDPDPFQRTTDLVGARVVCLFPRDLDALHQLVDSTFKVTKKENKVEGSETDVFGYMSMHYDCILPPTYNGTRYANLHGIPFEIQCRTLLMDAWANIHHKLAYKRIQDIPRDMQRDFSALSALLHIADKQFQQLREATDKLEKEAHQKIDAMNAAETLDAEINHSTVKALLHKSFPNRKPASDDVISSFVQEISAIELDSLAQLKKFLESGTQAALDDEKFSVPGTSVEYNQVGFARQALAEVNDRYRKYLTIPGL